MNDQGLVFFLPNMTWIQPPGYVHKMYKAAVTLIPPSPNQKKEGFKKKINKKRRLFFHRLSILKPHPLGLLGFAGSPIPGPPRALRPL